MSKIRVCEFDDLCVDSAQRFDLDGLKLALVRLDDDVFVIGDTCSHADFSLSEGELDTFDKTLECPKHGAAFSLETGEPQCLPATKSVPVFTAIIEEGTVFVGVEDESDGNVGRQTQDDSEQNDTEGSR